MSGFFAELKRRNVIRMAGLYLVGAWLVVQVASTMLPAFEAPAWTLRAVIIALAIGFVPAMVFAWVFELTAGGLKRDDEVPPAESIAPQTARRMDRMIIVVMALALGYFAVDKFVLSAQRPVASSPSPVTAERGTGTTPAASAAAAAASIAVLPFVNMSTDADNGYFADGISEELLNVLARIDGLTVASRTSSFTFKGKDVPIPEIARRLGVRHVLEGSVRKQGGRVRITAQLIAADADAHLWSQTYDRDLTDIFKVQEDIAQAIGNELVGLLPLAPEVTVTPSTGDIEAYELFLRGRARFHRRAEFAQAVADLEAAVMRDPDFGEAWVTLAATRYTWPGYDDAQSYAGVLPATREALARANALVPDSALANAVSGMIQIDEGRFADGVATLERAAAMRSDDPSPTLWYGLALLLAGHVDDARGVLERAQQRDPLSGVTNGYLSIALLCLGDDARSLALAERGLTEGWNAGVAAHAFDRILRGDWRSAADLIDKVPATLVTGDEAKALAAALRDPALVDAYLAMRPANRAGEVQFALGRNDAFFEAWKAELDGRRGLSATKWMLRTIWLPSARAVREDPRLFAIARRGGLVDFWNARGYPRGCRPEGQGDGEHLSCATSAP